MNAAITIGIHSSIEALLKKTGGDLGRVSEFLLIEKCSRRFSNTFLFTSDLNNYQQYVPSNIRHVPLGGRFRFLVFGWLVILRYIIKNRIKIVFVEGCTALPSVFLLNRLTSARTVLNYNYLWYLSYLWDRREKSIVLRLRKNRVFVHIVKIYEKLLISYIDYFIVASREIARFVGDKERILDIKKGIILTRFNPSKVMKHPIFFRLKDPSIVFTSRLDPKKDPITLINAFKIARKRNSNMNLIVAGDGELLDDCKTLADERTHFLGFERDIPGLLKGADIYVICSIFDPSPRSLLEAMAMGVPCIATSVGGIPDYLDSHTGVLIEPRNPKILAEKIISLMNDKEKAKALGENSRMKILKYHDLDKNIDNLLSIITRNL